MDSYDDDPGGGSDKGMEEDLDEPREPRTRTEGVRIIGADEAAAALDSGQASGRRPEDVPKYGDVPEPPAVVSPPAARFPLPDSVDPAEVRRPPLAGGPPGGDEPAGSTTAPAAPDLPHWTEPPTGEVPAVLAGGEEEDDYSAWSNLTRSGARWRDHPRDWDDADFGDAADLGVAVPGEQDDLVDPFAFEVPVPSDEEAPEAPAEAPSRTRWRRGRTGRPAPVGRSRVLAPDSGSRPEEPAGSSGPGPAGSRGPIPSGGPASIGPTSIGPVAAAGSAAVGAAAAGGASAGAAAGSSAGAGPVYPSRPAPRRVQSGGDGEPGGSGGPAARTGAGVRVVTGLGVGVVALLLLKAGPAPALALATLVAGAGAAEVFGVLRRAGYRPATLLGLTATVSVMVGAYLKGEAALPLVAALTTVFSFLWYLAGVVQARAVRNIGATLAGFMWVGFLGSYAGLLLNPATFPHRHGEAYLLGALIATVSYDVGGFVLGSRLGRHPLAPRISPAKTWEGLIGGMLASLVLSAVIVSQIHPWSFHDAVALGLVAAVVAPIGDLCQSLAKRDLGIKDMGTVLPGHGGLLDRIDAILFVLPATYYLVRVLGLG